MTVLWEASPHTLSSNLGYAAAAKSLQSCPTLCDPIDGSPPGSPIPGILQERTLEWVAISFSNAWKWKVKVTLLSRAQLLVTPWTGAHQAPPPMGFSRQEYRSGVPLPSPNLGYTLYHFDLFSLASGLHNGKCCIFLTFVSLAFNTYLIYCGYSRNVLDDWLTFLLI